MFRSSPLSFASQGATVYGEVLLPEGRELFPAAVLCHEPASDRRAMRPTALRLARRGIATLTFDFRGHGRSQGLFDGNTAADVVAAYRRFRQWKPVDPTRMALVGHSMGAQAVVMAASQLSEPCAVVALACPTGEREQASPQEEAYWQALTDLGPLEYPKAGPLPWSGFLERQLQRAWMGLRGYRLRVLWRLPLTLWRKARVPQAIRRMSPRPLLFVHCMGDRFIPYRVVLDLYRLAPSPKELLVWKGGFHSAPLLPGAVRRRWMDWLVRVLSKPVSGYAGGAPALGH